MSVEIEYINTVESWRIFDAAARRHFDMSGEDFMMEWCAFRWEGPDEDMNAMAVYMLCPSGCMSLADAVRFDHETS